MLFKSAALVAGLIGLAHARSGLLAKKDGYGDPTYDDGYDSPSYDEGYLPACPSGGYYQVYVSTNVVTYPVVIDQYFESNTIFIINGNVYITIGNAPTSLHTTVTVTTTKTVTSSANGVATPVLIQVQGSFAKRGGGASYLGSGGNIVSSCQQAAEFTIDNKGQLFSGGQQVSTDTGATEQLLAASLEVGDITTTFSANGGFSWTNNAFPSKFATFCAKGSLLYAEFDGTPAGCNAQILGAVPASGCGGSTTSMTSSSMTSMSTGFSNSTMKA